MRVTYCIILRDTQCSNGVAIVLWASLNRDPVAMKSAQEIPSAVRRVGLLSRPGQFMAACIFTGAIIEF